MQRPLVVAAALRLAVDGYDLPRAGSHRRLDPAQKAGLACRRIECGEDAAEGILGGNPVREREVLPEERFLAPPELLDGYPVVGATDRDRDDVEVTVQT